MKRNLGFLPPLLPHTILLMPRDARYFSLGLLIALAAASAAVEPVLPAPADKPVDFARDVQPLLARSCYSCHGPTRQKSNFRLDRRLAAFKGGDIGKAIVPHKSEESPLVRYAAGLEDGMLMPPEGEGKQLTAAEIGILRRWIDDGAAWPVNPSEEAKPTDWWSLKPLVRPAIPVASGGGNSPGANPIDAFVLAKLSEQRLSPSPPADRTTLIRRLTYDLHGLPPTPEEIESFERDESPDAYERLVDRLLASPHYGERWARHWLDVVHYGESNGYGMDRPRMNAWPYRDYLIASFNSDKPYSRFVQEQIAADALFPDQPQLTAALGFAASGPFNQSALVEQVDGTECKRIALNLDRDDMVTTVSATFLSMTVHCARCHEHKFDPLTQKDYYRLQAVFAGVGRAERPFDADPAVKQRREELAKLKADLEKQPDSHPPTPEETEQLAKAQIAWEQSLSDQAALWTNLNIEKIESTHNATTFARQDDGSYLAGGEAADKDTYKIVAKATLAKLSAIRLEVLADDRLPMKGPGRQDNGNLHLSEIRVSLVPDAAPDKPVKLTLQNPTADFNQQGWGIERAIDGNAGTAWGIHPEVGKSHQAVFEIKEPADAAQGTILIELDQVHGGHHLIGRLRLSATDKAQPVRIPQFAPDVLAILARPVDQRSEAERQRLFQIHRLKFIGDQLASLPPQQLVWAIDGKFPQRRNYKSVTEPYPIHILRRGNLQSPEEEVTPGGFECVTTLRADLAIADPKSEGQRRAALAQWITSPQNMLTWRSIANRVWHYHFGRGIVDSPNDFGRMGSLPTHPELLDYLAAELRDGDGSLKSLHRLIVTSATYRQTSVGQSHALSVRGRSTAPSYNNAQTDSDNRYLWRMSRPRLDAESLRDSLLAASGMLDSTMGGPSVMQFKYDDPNMEVSPRVDYMAFDPDSPSSFRRGIYRFLFRNVNDPLLEAFDVSDPSLSVSKRNMTITSLQALSLWNNRFVLRQCEHLAVRVERESPDLPSRIDRAHRLLLGRPPTTAEAAQLAAFAHKHSLAAVCRVLVNSNEFLFVR
jgi:mono/diheme cytochrome c family protein